MTASGTTGCSDQVKSGNNPDERCLRRGAAHILHEVDLLRYTRANQNDPVSYTLWFVTGRGLIDFLLCSAPGRQQDGSFKDDILAADYLPVGEWEKRARELRLQKPAGYEKWRDATNKLAAHLTYSRVDFEAEDYNPSPEMHNFVLGVFAVWLAQLSPEHRVWFGAGMS